MNGIRRYRANKDNSESDSREKGTLSLFPFTAVIQALYEAVQVLVYVG